MPDTIAASWSPLVRSRSSDMAMSSPSADTTSVCRTPGTLFTKLSRSQLKLAASVLIVVTVVVLRRICGGSAGWLIGQGGADLERMGLSTSARASRRSGLRLVVLGRRRCRRGTTALHAGPEAAEHGADVGRVAGPPAGADGLLRLAGGH